MDGANSYFLILFIFKVTAEALTINNRRSCPLTHGSNLLWWFGRFKEKERDVKRLGIGQLL